MSCLPYMYISMFTGATEGADHIQMTGGCTWCHDVTGNIDTRHCHVSRSVMCHNLTGAAPLMQQQRRRKCWRIGLKMSGQLTQSEEVGTRGLIKDGTIYGEVFVWEIVWSIECGEERRQVRRDAGLWHRVSGDIPHHRMSVPWCQHQRPGARRSLASCSVRSCSAHPGSAAVKSSAVSHGPAGRAAHTNTRSVSLKPSSGKK